MQSDVDRLIATAAAGATMVVMIDDAAAAKATGTMDGIAVKGN